MGVGEGDDRDGREKDRKKDRSGRKKERDRDAREKEEERQGWERERERQGRKRKKLQTQKIHGILSCRASLHRTG